MSRTTAPRFAGTTAASDPPVRGACGPFRDRPCLEEAVSRLEGPRSARADTSVVLGRHDGRRGGGSEAVVTEGARGRCAPGPRAWRARRPPAAAAPSPETPGDQAGLGRGAGGMVLTGRADRPGEAEHAEEIPRGAGAADAGPPAKEQSMPIDFNEKTARPSNVGPRDRQADQHDPNARKRRPGEMYGNEVEGQAAIVAPSPRSRATRR